MVRFSVRHPVVVTLLMVLLAAVLAAAGASRGVKIDTDPENMLSVEDPARQRHDELKEKFAVHDMIVVGVVNEEDPDGVFNPQSLKRIYALTNYAKQLRGEGLEPGQIDMDKVLADAGLIERPEEEEKEPPAGEREPAPPPPSGADAPPPAPPGGGMSGEGPPPLPGGGEAGVGPDVPPLPGTGEETADERVSAAGQTEQEARKGVVVIDLLAPSTVDRIEHRGGKVHFSYLLKKPLPDTRDKAAPIREGGLDNPLLNGTVVSGDGKAVAIYLPITHKDISYQVS